MDDNAISIQHVSKDFHYTSNRASTLKSLLTSALTKKDNSKDIQHALADINIDIKKGEFFGIVGRNGSGKSTLLKIIAGIYQPNQGKVVVNGKLVPFIELGVGFNPDLTGKENIYLNGALLGFSVKEVSAMYDDIVKFAELEKFMDQKLKNYSSGMQVRLAFSIAIRARSEILLIDEVLAVGDAAFQRKCYNYFRQLRKSDQTVVFISHDMDAVRQFCDRVALIKNSKVVAIGDAEKVSQEYSKMFVDEGLKQHGHATAHRTDNGEEERWGDEQIRFEDVEVKITEETVTIKCVAKAKVDIETPIYGFSVKNSDDHQLLGTNTVKLSHKVAKIAKGAKHTVVWTIPNLFNTGAYSVDITLAHEEPTTVSDRWSDAITFEIMKGVNTPYLVNPDIKVES